MDVKAIARGIRMSPMKVNVVLGLIRRKGIAEAYSILMHTDRRAAGVIEKVLKSAVANAENNNGLDRNELFIKEAYVTNGTILKRFQPHAQGRAFRINKRTSHITIVVAEKAK